MVTIGTHRNRELRNAVQLLQAAGGRIAVIIVDENDSDADPSRDRLICHQAQAAILRDATANGWAIFGTTMSVVPGNMGYTDVYSQSTSWGAVLDAAIPDTTTVYHKSAMETDGFANTQLVTDFAGNFDHVIIMGQSVNACCAATARGAAARGAQVHTSRLIVRGGGVQTTAPTTGYNWPAGSQFYLFI